ncbi:MAG: flagellar hook-associated protein FlgL [Peptococcaceae bacterium]|nr:flagellar hook-associated protein FlgL [Peptococcaceae bacterium]
MRITHTVIGNRMMKSVQYNLEELAKAQERMSTGKRVNRPSDDPTATSQIMEIESGIDRNRQYIRNITDGLAWVYETDAALNDALGLLHKARELAVQASNDTYSPEDRQTIARQIEGIMDGMEQVANRQMGNKYIFAGNKTDTKPFNNGVFQINTSDPTFSENVKREIGRDEEVEVNAYVETTFENIFATLASLRDNLDANNTAGIEQNIGDLDNNIDAVLVHRVKIGSRTRHLEALKSQLEDQEVRLAAVKSSLQDSDIGRAAIDFTQQQIAYRAALSAGAKLMQMSLIDYLR